MKKTVAIGLLGTQLDMARKEDRWTKWRPTIGLCTQESLLVDRLELLYEERFAKLAETVQKDLATASPETEVRLHSIQWENPWDFEEVYSVLDDFAESYPFDEDNEDYLVHITTGTHVCQICLFLLNETHRLPGRLIQTAPPRKRKAEVAGSYSLIDLDLSRYDRLAERFDAERQEGLDYLKAGIATRNEAFNRTMAEIEQVAIASHAPILLLGPTGAGKTRLARRIYELKHSRAQVKGRFVEVNCGTLRGDAAMSALFGHKKGAFTGAMNDRAGLLKAADGGLLFLDEIGELGLDEQVMLLRALEEKRFLPVGADTEAESHFQLIAGTNRDLPTLAAEGKFRDDLLARLNLWTYRLPGLKDRREDLRANLEFELAQFRGNHRRTVRFNQEALRRYLQFAESTESEWSGNFRDLNASVTRMATLATGGRINEAVVEAEITRLRQAWAPHRADHLRTQQPNLVKLRLSGKLAELDRFDEAQLEAVLEVCRCCNSLSEAGRQLFAVSRAKKRSTNDADRLKKYLARFELSWSDLDALR
jgi:transcriptional regulatory protein RtcR